ncbi:uncharacterized protein LOC105428831 isoform X2 [Pogonomyrmex barbatus]|uniref:Regulatory protein zeste n=1 Tax=Pogonomyrmex barbatus TaxID=144034 RepID=A0A8N1S901_9HYME|nr:uncharacterized protein LOC105428831 isoform X2 [Pogonomyrmex barbatus]
MRDGTRDDCYTRADRIGSDRTSLGWTGLVWVNWTKIGALRPRSETELIRRRESGERKKKREKNMSATNEATTVLLKKRERTQNWIPEEKSALLALIKHHANAIENKKIDAAASAMKSLAWQQIYCAFRGRFSADRDITRIREQWRRMKAQARMELYTYAEKVRTLGPEAAEKSRPSSLSIEVWRLMESMRKNDCEIADRSDDSSQDNENPTSRTSIHAILDKLLPTPETSGSSQEIKMEINSDIEDENSHGELSQKASEDGFLQNQKRPKITIEDEPIDLMEQKIIYSDSISTSRVDNGTPHISFLLSMHARKWTLEGMFYFQAAEHNDARNEPSVDWNDGPTTCDRDKSMQRATWIFKSTQREHELKLRMLHIELERAELQKQTAVNELKTSELKKQLMQDQADEYYRCRVEELINSRQNCRLSKVPSCIRHS